MFTSVIIRLNLSYQLYLARSIVIIKHFVDICDCFTKFKTELGTHSCRLVIEKSVICKHEVKFHGNEITMTTYVMSICHTKTTNMTTYVKATRHTGSLVLVVLVVSVH